MPQAIRFTYSRIRGILDQCGVVLQLSGELDAHILTHFHFNKTPMGMEMQKHVDVGDIGG